MSDPPSSPNRSTDFSFLREEGIRRLEQMAGHLWTDFNTHDPGVTILEQLCYAITDLGYRAAHDLPDILSEGGADPESSLHSAARILTCAPVTLDDLRRLILDVNGVKNAWIEPVEDPRPAVHHDPGARELRLDGAGRSVEPVKPRGLYRILIEKSDFADIAGSTIRRDAARRFLRSRGLGEDLDDVQILAPQDVEVHADLEIAPTEDPEGVAANVLEAVQNYLSPHVEFRTLDEMRARGLSVDEVFDGPALDHGFIDDESLARLERCTTVHRSDLIHAIMEVEHVRAVRDVRFTIGAETSQWRLALHADVAPRLDYRRSTIRLEREHRTVTIDDRAVVDRYLEERRSVFAFEPRPRSERDVPVPRGRDRKLGNYYSIQHHLPAAYGVGAAGLAASAPPERKARAKQLKAYLLIFDQILANSFAQLAGARDLLSFTGDPEPTYFTRMIDDASLGLEEIRRGSPAAHEARLRAISDPATARTKQRKNRFLSHLMARFAEEFSDYSRTNADESGASATDRRVRNKQTFLARYPELSGGRGTGYDTTKVKPSASYLEERLALELGLDPSQEEYFHLVEHILLRPVEEDRPPEAADELRRIPLLAEAARADPYSFQVTFVFPDWPDRFQDAGFWKSVLQTVRAQTPAHLTAYVRRLGRKEMLAFHQAFTAWRKHWHAYQKERLGL